METSIRRRRKVLLHFVLGIGLPSLLLAYLAWRGIQNDTALLEKEQLRRHRAIAQQITSAADDAISLVEVRFNEVISRYGANPLSSAFRDAIEHLKDQHGLIEEVFIIEHAERIHFPLATLLFHLNSDTPGPPAQVRPPALIQGQQYEFQQQRYDEALRLYTQALAQDSTPEIMAEALAASARVRKKLQRLSEAISSYETMAQDYGHVRLAGGMPAGLVAGLELGDLFLAVNNPDKAVETLVCLYRELIHGQWRLIRAEFDFFTQQTGEAIDGILAQYGHMSSQQRAVEGLRREEQQQRELTERLHTFQEMGSANLSSLGNRSEVPPAYTRIAMDLRGQVYLVSQLSETRAQDVSANSVWGLLLDPEQLKTGILEPALRQHMAADGIQWLLRGRGNQTILSSNDAGLGSVTVRANFSGNFPPWSLEFTQQGPRLMETLLTSWRSIYLYMFVLLAGILIFGLTLTMRIVSHELELGKMKSDFVSTVSHEFKSPLTSIRQLAEMLQAGRVPTESRRQQYYNVLLEQSERLSLLIDNILDFAKMEEGRRAFDFETIDMGLLLKEVTSGVQQRVQHEGFTVALQLATPMPPLWADRAAITQALTNLIDNAVKYSSGAKEVTIRAYTENKQLVIAVKDLGIGIKRQEVDRIFERFYRGGDELTRTVKGSGLGLTLVKQVVEAHQGSVLVESEPGQGSTFSLRLPLMQTEA